MQYQPPISNARRSFTATYSVGFEELFGFTWDVGHKALDSITGLKDSSAKVMMLKAGNACVELFEYATPTSQTATAHRSVCDHGITHLCLQVSDIDEEYARLKAAGMVFHCSPQQVGDDLRVTYGRDPDGNVIELLEPVKDSPLAVVKV